MGKGDNFVVDTKNLCFLCYRPAKIIAAGVKGRVKDKTFSLRCISRYMKVDFQKMMKTDLGFSSPCGEHEGGCIKFPQVLVTVCSRCSVLTEEFAALHQYLEFTQMKINACIRNMNELMKKTNGNARLVEKFRKKMNASSSIVDPLSKSELVENTRQEIMKNCSGLLKNAFPRVQVKSFEENNEVKIRKSKVKPAPRSKKPGFSSTILKKDCPTAIAIMKESIVTDDDKTVGTLSSEIKEKGGLFQCLHCDNTFNDTGGLRVHIVRYHREQFFAMFKSAAVSEEDFKFAVELLFQDVRKITANSGTQSTVSYVCSCCGKPFSAKIDTYVHMVQLHHDALSTKLQSIQKNGSMISAAKKTVQLPDPSTLRKRGKIRGPYKKKERASTSTTSNVTIKESNLPSSNGQATQVAVISSKRKRIATPKQKALQAKSMSGTGSFPRTCECGVILSSRSSWNNHQKLHCKLKSVVPLSKNIQATTVRHPSLKRAKNSVGFPRTCACGVRLAAKSSWFNHQKMHCKLKFSGKTKTTGPIVSNSDNQTVPTLVRKRKGRLTNKPNKMPPLANRVLLGNKADTKKYDCECGITCKTYKTWYYHKTKACKLRNANESFSFDLDLIEEVPIDITPSGDLCLPSTSTSIETSPIPKILKVSSSGGVIKGLQKMASFQDTLLKREIKSVTPLIQDTSSYSELFSKYFPVTPAEDISASLQKVLEDYRKFPGNISGCPYCGRGFTQVVELQSHMVDAHFEEVLFKLKNLIDPSGMTHCSYDIGDTINVDPNLVKTENVMETDSNDICTMGPAYSQNFQLDDLEKNPLEEIAAKREVSYLNEENTVNEDGEEDLLLILP